MTRAQAIELVEVAREQAEWHYHRGDIPWTASKPDCPDVMRLAALMEECGEVARALHDHTNLTDELAQLAGVAVGWLEALPQP